MEIPKIDKLQGRKTLKVAGFLEEFEKDDIKKNIDIVELFASFNVKLGRKGKSFMGLCPWHNEQTPSLSVDQEKGLYNCFGCGEAGDAFDLVEKMKGYDFKEALVYLKNFKGGVPQGYGVKTAAPIPVPPASGVEKKSSTEPVERRASLNTIRDYYHKRLFDHPEALEYLKKRGFSNPALYERFQIGYSDGSLNLVIGESQRQALTEAGIFSDSGKEHFLNCLVFPILDESGNTISFYGRDVDDNSGFKHRYLKGPHRGVFNRKASKAYDEIILTECIIDALSLIETGLENVQAIYGANGFTDEHLEILKSDRVKTVILALDNDEAGKRASESLKERLISEGFRVKIISSPGGLVPEVKDWNELLSAGKLDKEGIKTLIEQAAMFKKEEELTQGCVPLKVREEKGQLYFIYSEGPVPISYRLTGVKEMFVNSLKVTVKAESWGDYFIDTVDLYLYRSRTNFATHLASQFGMETKRIEKDLLDILDYLEKQKDRRSLSESEEKHELTEEERRIGLEFLKSPDIFEQIVNDMNILGYVGEDMNKKLLYLCATSRKMDNPISVMIVSESASGKSYLVDTVKKLIPDDELLDITSLSDQALNYIKDLSNKFMVFGESVFNETIEHLIREMLSGKQLSRYVTIKDEKTGELITKKYSKEVIVASVMSTTNRDMNPENASRYFLINADESKEQTRRIFESQRKKYSLERHYARAEQIPAIIAKHQSAQKLLQKRVIVNPIAPFMDFPDSLMRLRRDHDRFIDLMAVICFLRQYQKVIKTDGSGTRPVEYIECDDTDYIIAREFVSSGMLSSTLDDLPKSVKRFYEELRSLLKGKSEEAGLKPTEAEIQQREIRKRIDWLGSESIKKHLRMLTRYEYIVLKVGGQRGHRFTYSLAADEPIENIDISMIPTIDEIHERMKADKVGKNTHVSAKP
jgi:DNA primase catalytic core